MKKVLSIVLAISIVACLFSGLTFSVSADTENGFTYSVSNGEATITGDDSDISGNITIPSTLGGYPVTSIDEKAFYGRSGLTSITIPNSVKSIGSGAFSYCTNLTSIEIPYGVKSIGSGAFCYCTNLTSIEIPYGVTSIGKSTFCLCFDLTNVSIPNSVKSIGCSAFGGCTGLKSITIPNSVKSIGCSAFEGCTGLTSVTIGNSVKDIANNAFEGCTGLTSITIPNSVTSIGEYAFDSCEKLKTVYYTGSKSQKSKIKIDKYNQPLTKATWKYAATISISASKYTYNGKTKTPTVTVKDAAGKKLTKNKDYTVSYAKGRKNVGKYTVKVTLKNGYYNNSATRQFVINPKGTTVSKLTTPKTKQITVTWGKQATQTTGYQIQYSKSKTFASGNKNATVTSSKTTSKTLTGLTKGKTYYVRIRTYKTVSGTKYYSAWSTAKYIKTK